MGIKYSGLLLVVEDEPELLMDLSESLTAHGFQVLCAHDGEDALRVLESNQPDAILSDIKMPKKDGIELINELRNRGDDTPCVILTAYYDQENAVDALRLGVVDFIEKPFIMENLVETLAGAAELGMTLKKLENELEDLYQSLNVSDEDQQYFKRARLARMLMRRKVKSAVKKRDN